MEKSFGLMGKTEYQRIFRLFADTLQIWKLNNIYSSVDSTYSVDYADSLICFNTTKNRLVTCVLNKYVNKNVASVADGIKFFYGEKIENQWYFFGGPSIHVPREMVENHNDYEPLSYQQLHEIALKEVYGGYLNSKGEINEEWFTGQFEGSGWGDFNKQESSLKFLHREGKPFTDRREFFEAIHLQSTRNNWLHRDTTKAIVQLP